MLTSRLYTYFFMLGLVLLGTCTTGISGDHGPVQARDTALEKADDGVIGVSGQPDDGRVVPRSGHVPGVDYPSATAVRRALHAVSIPHPTLPPQKRQNDGQIQALSGEIQRLSQSISSVSSSASSVSQASQSLRQSAEQAVRQATQSLDQLNQAMSRTQSSASSAMSQASRQADERLAQLSSSMSREMSQSMSSVQASASRALSAAEAAASSLAANAMIIAVSRVQAAQAGATAVGVSFWLSGRARKTMYFTFRVADIIIGRC
jgi:ElaB/YqjD/DUF883 family membrane-anchored ribosome-binding protein